MIFKRTKSGDPILERLNIGMSKIEVFQVLQSSNLTNIGEEDFPPGQDFSSKIYAKRGGWFSSWWGYQSNFHLYFDTSDKLVKIGFVPLLSY